MFVLFAEEASVNEGNNFLNHIFFFFFFRIFVIFLNLLMDNEGYTGLCKTILVKLLTK